MTKQFFEDRIKHFSQEGIGTVLIADGKLSMGFCDVHMIWVTRDLHDLI